MGVKKGPIKLGWGSKERPGSGWGAVVGMEKEMMVQKQQEKEKREGAESVGKSQEWVMRARYVQEEPQCGVLNGRGPHVQRQQSHMQP